jgi:predicted nucleic acid-binding protein
MIAVDSDIIISITNGEPSAHAAVALLMHHAQTTELVVCAATVAEIGRGFRSTALVRELLSDMHIRFHAMSFEAALKAGQCMYSYATRGGKTRPLKGDFLIGAHALVDCTALLTIDGGFKRDYFRDLRVISP